MSDIPGSEPAGSGDYEVRQGECLISIASAFGHFWQTLWDLPANQELKNLRKDPMVLLAGDRLTIPPLREKIVSAAADRRHKFVRKGIPAKLRLRFCDDGQPLADLPYVLDVDGNVQHGNTDGDGWVQAFIAPDATAGSLTVGEGDAAHTYRLDLGHLDPVETVRGAQARLRNLGYLAGPPDGVFGQNTRRALKAFQKKNRLPETGELDADTRAKLKELHKS